MSLDDRLVEPNCPVVDFDHNSAEHAADTVASYRRLRALGPVVRSPRHGGFWVFTDYEGVFDAARDDQVFSSARCPFGGEGLATVIPKTPVNHHIPVELDPPEHRKYRKLINPLTTPAAVERLRPSIEKYTTRFIDRVIEDGQCDFATIIGVPAVVTIDWLGLPADDWERYAHAHHAALSELPGSAEFTHAIDVDFPWMEEQLRATIGRRRIEPREDVLSHLLASQIDGRPLTDDEVFAMAELLISGGVGTTASLVAQTLMYLDTDRDLRRNLIRYPEKLPRAVEEFLRVFSPTQALARTVTRDVEFRGHRFHTGDRVLLSWASANRDADAFDDPDSVDIDRWPNRHTSFGMGVHRCAGSHLARALAVEMLGRILGRMPDYEILHEEVVPFPHQAVNPGWKKIPARFTPGPRCGSAGTPAR
ncbi:Cytochrome P450 [Rhodococcus rhodochrous J3]|uniref:Cytochrome P450 n=2 Tax=Rhodococcus rhodochrous TaxID=1829 RepID=A0AA47A5N4_RHORH|nr:MULTISPECIES: cytochrome P450 [Rhodococcus]MBF4480238.1 cytochrome P450 [Rhodococcus rhodochrous]MDC3724318.1 cytochrome P450 [Rhodococcus sp. Rp3]MDJ0401282.1 cytochrome P450 [Rhodococcus rhodochrous]TWH62158.1 cytochrome P450 [Rhodococcus rhodochrous J38]UZF44889.1 cytochrome P450 [Rhodococcus rhodochrous]